MSPREPSGASKNQKAAFSKKWFSRGTVCIFSLLRPPKRASRGPRRLPRGTQRAPKPKKKGSKLDPQINTFWTNFGAILGPKMGLQKGTKNRTTFWTPLHRISGVRITPRQKINERGEKPTGAGIILSKRKGGIRPHKTLSGLIRPYKAL